MGTEHKKIGLTPSEYRMLQVYRSCKAQNESLDYPWRLSDESVFGLLEQVERLTGENAGGLPLATSDPLRRIGNLINANARNLEEIMGLTLKLEARAHE